MKQLNLIGFFATVTMLVLPLFMQAQKDTSKHEFPVDTSFQLPFFNADTMSLEMQSIQFQFYEDWAHFNLEDSTVEIWGDTIKVLWQLVALINQKDSTIKEYAKTVQAGVDFSNHVSDYFKTRQNKWNQFVAALRKHGYTIQKLK